MNDPQLYTTRANLTNGMLMTEARHTSIRTVWLHLQEVQKQAKLARATRVASHEASDWQGAEEAHGMLESFFLDRGGSVQVTEAHQVYTYGAYTFCIYVLL